MAWVRSIKVLVFSHNPWLVLASLCVALMAGFTGLSLTKGLSAQPLAQRKSTIVLSAIAMGGDLVDAFCGNAWAAIADPFLL